MNEPSGIDKNLPGEGLKFPREKNSGVNRALLVSKIFHPLLIAPVLALFFLLQKGLGLIGSVSWISLWVFLALTPTAIITYFTGKRKLNIESGPARRRGYLTGISAVIVSLVLTWYLSAPEPVINLGLIAIFSAGIFGVANHVEKISVHTGALAGFSGIYLALSPFWSGSVAFLALLVGWSRVDLEVHSREQVMGGAFLGVLCGLAVLVL